MVPLGLALLWCALPLLFAAVWGVFGLPRLLTGLTFAAGLASLLSGLSDAETAAWITAMTGSAYADYYVSEMARQHVLISFLLLFGLGGVSLILHPLLSAPTRVLCLAGYGLLYLGMGIGLLPALWLPQMLHGPDVMATMQLARAASTAATAATVAGQIALLLVLPGEAAVRFRRWRHSPSARSGKPA